MLAAIVPAPFQYVGEADQVGLHIGLRVNERIPHTWLSGEMNDMEESVPGEERRHAVVIGQIQSDKPKGGVHRQPRQTRFLQGGIVVGVEIVQADDRVPCLQQAMRNRLAAKGVQVITVKPGFVATRMTA